MIIRGTMVCWVLVLTSVITVKRLFVAMVAADGGEPAARPRGWRPGVVDRLLVHGGGGGE
jgi:hypothetical protein